MRKERINEIWGVLFLLAGLFTLTSLVFFRPEDLPFYTSHPDTPLRNYTGILGAYLAFALRVTFGSGSILIPGLFLLWSACFFLQQVPEKKFFKFMGLGVALFSMSTLIAISVDPDLRFEQGGAVGFLAGTYLLKYLGNIGSFILAGACLLLSLLLATDFLIYSVVQNLAGGIHRISTACWKAVSWFRETFLERGEVGAGLPRPGRGDLAPTFKRPVEPKTVKAKTPPPSKLVTESGLEDAPPLKVKRYTPDGMEESGEAPKQREAASKSKEKSSPSPLPPLLSSPRTSGGRIEVGGAKEKPPQEESSEGHEGVVGSRRDADSDYQFPTVDYLKRPEKGAVILDNLQENSRILEDTLGEFGIEVKVTEVEQGPVITRYELLPAPGVKVNSIAALSDDIALALKAASVRLIIPIPGKSAIGVEVPNSVASKVCLRELMEHPALKAKKHILPLVLGKDTSGNALIVDLTGMPHILIAGTTGSGKTVCVNSIICGLIYNCTPEELKFVMVDPKMVELAVYNRLPHMLSPVVTDTKKAAHTLNWVVSEMENRYRLLATVGVRNIQAFNSRPLSEEAIDETEGMESENVIPPKLPYIIVVIDELADLMMVAQDKVEGAITRLAQLSRAVGIHLILATQRPSVDVITGVIKANFPARISFKVASKVDSRTVLDASGADKLIGKGDMLLLQPGTEKLIRGQAAFVSDEEINAVVNFAAQQRRPDFHPGIQALQEGKRSGDIEDKDELFDEAVDIVLQTGQASTSNLQRRLRLGYTRAARIIDQMESLGVVGPAQGAKPRDILISRESSQPVE